MALNKCETWFNGIWNSLFFKKSLTPFSLNETFFCCVQIVVRYIEFLKFLMVDMTPRKRNRIFTHLQCRRQSKRSEGALDKSGEALQFAHKNWSLDFVRQQ